MFSKRVLVGAMALLTPLAVIAEESGNQTTPQVQAVPNAPQGELETTQPPAGEGKIYGLAELRPSFTTSAGEWHTENTLEGGYQFDKNTRLTYVQWFNTNLAPVAGTADAGKGVNLTAQDGLFRIRANKLWESADKTTSFNFQGRAYVPTFAPRREAGYITSLRPYFTFKKTVGPVDFILAEAPTFHAYTKAGHNGKANPVFENVLIFETDFNITDKLVFMFPVVLSNTRHRDFAAGATNNNSWQAFAYVWPEIGWSITDHHSLGVAFYSDNFLKADMSGFTLGSAFEKGVAQLVWAATL